MFLPVCPLKQGFVQPLEGLSGGATRILFSMGAIRCYLII